MSQGRCAGCGLTGKSAALVREHVRYCPEYEALFKADPGRALEPEAEFARWVAEQRVDDRAEHREGAIAEADRRRAVQANRWKTPADLLDGPDE